MRRWIGPLVVMVLIAVPVHWLTLNLAPGVIMDRAMTALEARGVALHAFTTPQRVTPQTQQVVRSSPDLYYALCRYDLRQREDMKHVATSVTVTMAPWDDYQSLSFFDARTNNFATVRGTGKAIMVELRSGIGQSGFVEPSFGYDPLSGGPTLEIDTPTDTGVILIRRLAPTDESFAKAVEAGKGDSCSFTVKPTIVY
jgi:uncharacterized membrane protein